ALEGPSWASPFYFRLRSNIAHETVSVELPLNDNHRHFSSTEREDLIDFELSEQRKARFVTKKTASTWEGRRRP
ncbi:MAG: hypothetical protein AAF438_11280, partial [Pseudomonadota bacterium]